MKVVAKVFLFVKINYTRPAARYRVLSILTLERRVVHSILFPSQFLNGFSGFLGRSRQRPFAFLFTVSVQLWSNWSHPGEPEQTRPQ